LHFFCKLGFYFTRILKNLYEIFRKNSDLLDEPEVMQLLEYCEKLQDEIVDFKFEKQQDKQLILLDIIREIVKGCNEVEKEQMEHERFNYPAPNYQETIKNLKFFILKRCEDERIYL
jgi:predicted house-cleaning noncanonical NTP pyrophosphatase (MazG superfamily)